MKFDAISTNGSNGLVKQIGVVADEQRPSSEVFPCGIELFDNAMDGGFRGGDLVVISGQTSHGKTTFSQFLTINQSGQGVPSIWFSYEMSTFYLGEQFSKMGVDTRSEDFLVYAPSKLDRWSIEKSMKIVREAISEYGCKFIFIDHLHYLIPLNQSINTSLLVGGVLRELKSLAVETDTVVCLLAHTKKLAAGEELNLDSMRDSSLIAQEADSVFLVQRIKNPKKAMVEVSGNIYSNITKIELAKVRRTGQCCFQKFKFINHKYVPHEDDTCQEENTRGVKKFPKYKRPPYVGEGDEEGCFDS